jgi:dTDP-glucose 4,6-dehydratase|tara:strand:+ start:8966 stop:9907 length:942 start_codon:yes stop_codon:yes gene_type:complete
MKNVMITGCAGFIGSYVTEEFLNAGYKVYGVDKMTYAGNRESLNSFLDNPNFSFSPSCITIPSHMKHLVKVNNIDWIINLAAETHVDNSIESSDVFVKTNIQGTKSLLDTCRETGAKLLHFSTDEVYGVAVNRAFTERSNIAPKNPYSATKAAADHMIEAYRNTYGTEHIIVRPSNNFGLRQHDEKFLPTIIRKLKADEKIPVYGKGDQIREWTHARETAKATRFILENSGMNEIYNISSEFHTENMNVVQSVCDILGRRVEDCIEYVEDRPGHDFKYSITPKKLNNLGYTVSSNFKDELKEIVDYEFSSIRH